MSDDDLEQLKAFAERLADAARAETLPRFRAGAQVFNKAGIWYDPVTDADREAERAQRRLITAIYPRHGVLGEEFGEHLPDAPSRWVLDPVDGTRAFVCGATSWATLIAFERNATPLIGVIDQPFTDERWIGDGANTIYKRGGDAVSGRMSGVKSLEKARLLTTDPRRAAYFTGDEAEAFERASDRAQLTRFGLDAYAYALLAIGEVDIVIEAGLKRHDFSALAPIVAGAGGVITNWRGAPMGADERGQIIAAATPELHEEALSLLSPSAKG